LRRLRWWSELALPRFGKKPLALPRFRYESLLEFLLLAAGGLSLGSKPLALPRFRHESLLEFLLLAAGGLSLGSKPLALCSARIDGWGVWEGCKWWDGYYL